MNEIDQLCDRIRAINDELEESAKEWFLLLLVVAVTIAGVAYTMKEKK